KAYARGNLIAAVSAYPAGREPASNSEKLYLAALLLSVGQVEKAQALMAQASPPAGAGGVSPPVAVADAIRKVIGAVKSEAFEAKLLGGTSSEWLAQSYAWQARSE